MKNRKKRRFPRSMMETLFADAGASSASVKAAMRLNAELTTKATEIAELAVKFAEHSGRKTVKEKDISLAALFC
ncbi:MAG: histone [Candidatus Hodarchaeota archaeon]